MSGGGWSYIRSCCDVAGINGFGRRAYFTLFNQANSSVNITLLTDQARDVFKGTVWDGPRKGYTFEKFKRKWYNAIATLERYGKSVPCPSDRVSDFIVAVTDPRLKPAGILIMNENSPYRNDFPMTAAYFTRLLAMESARDSRASEAKRKLSALGGGGGGGGRGGGRGR